MLTDDLLALQDIDTSIDQDLHHRAHLAERDRASAAADARRSMERRVAAIDARHGELEAAVATLEREGETMQRQRVRLDGQLRTVTAVRQAEALQHELIALAARRDELDDHELAHLEEQAELQAEQISLDASRPAVVAASEEAAAALTAAESAIDVRLSAVRAARQELVGRIDDRVVERYEGLRVRFRGVAVAALDGARCTGCHLDLSPGEVGEVRSTPDGEFAECPQCGRLLVP
ncbi:MAG: zinc ribbon domain-containing protein [Ilumatobacteraceae bacterium]